MFTGAVGGIERTLNSEQVSVADDAISKASKKQVKLGEQSPSRADSRRGVKREREGERKSFSNTLEKMVVGGGNAMTENNSKTKRSRENLARVGTLSPVACRASIYGLAKKRGSKGKKVNKRRKLMKS